MKYSPLLIVTLWHVACDGVVGSLVVPDQCGVCGGDNSTCRIISGIFTRPQLPRGYNVITQIPAGACNLSISELKYTKNSLALRISNGSYILNGDWVTNWSGDYHAAGTIFTYRRSDGRSSETVYSPGPLSEQLDLMVIYEEPNPGIKYQYQLPLLRPELEASSLSKKPDIRPFSGENGIRYNVDNARMNNTFPLGNGLQDVQPNGQPQNEVVRRPKVRKRKVNWKVSGFTECSKTCGGGVKISIVVCVREYNQMPVPNRRCGALGKPGQKTIRCNSKPCVAQWVTEDWSSCSVTCGEGVERRNVVCRQEITPTLTINVAEGACLTRPPEGIQHTRTCHLPPCTAIQEQGKWTVGFWSQCSSRCGLGLKTRTVYCASGDCSSSTRPASTSSCDNGPCPDRGDISSRTSTWLSTEWSVECTASCGTGIQTRKVFCSAKDTTCDVQYRPEVYRACSSDKQCGGQWYTGPWSQCSEECGVGRQTRDVVCLARVRNQLVATADTHCLTMDKPVAEQQCRRNQCNPQWYMADWTQCSQSCGAGIQRREVLCLHGNQIESNQCREESKPVDHRTCNLQQCFYRGRTPPYEDSRFPAASLTNNTFFSHNKPLPSHHTTDVNECSDKYYNCHMVVQARLCKYKYYRTSCCYSCRHRLSIVTN